MFSHVFIVGIIRWQFNVVQAVRISVFFFFFFFFYRVVFMMSKSYYDFHRGYHENGCAFICPVLSLPNNQPTPQPLPSPLFVFWIVWRWTASCLLRWMPTVSQCLERLWQAGRVEELPASRRWHLCICTATDQEKVERRSWSLKELVYRVDINVFFAFCETIRWFIDQSVAQNFDLQQVS